MKKKTNRLKKKPIQARETVHLASFLSHGLRSHSHTANQLLWLEHWNIKLISLRRLEFRLFSRSQTEEHRQVYPFIHLSVHLSICSFSQPARRWFSWQECGSLWQAHWQAREQLGIVGQKDDMSACRADVEGKAYMQSTHRTHLCGMHGILAALPRQKKKKYLMKTSWTSSTFGNARLLLVAASFISATQEQGKCMWAALIAVLTF